MKAFIVLSLFLLSVYSCPYWEIYYQCDAQWGSQPLGTSTSETVCTAGCAMSDVAMALASYGTYLNGALVNPGSLNQWLNANGGYADSDLIVWASVNVFGTLTFVEEVKDMTQNQLATYVKDCYPVVVNVREGTHWVLITNTTSDPNVWEVNDPYFNEQYYDFSTMLEWVVYQPSA